MDRRAFLLGTGALGLVACTAPERDLLESYDGVDIPLQPGVTRRSRDRRSSHPRHHDANGNPVSPMQALRDSIEPAEDRVGVSFVARARADEVAVEETPGDGVARWTFANPIDSGDDLVFLVEDYDGLDHYQVLLPDPTQRLVRLDPHRQRRPAAPQLRHPRRARRVPAHRLRSRPGRAWRPTVGVARDNAPTPRGRYYTTELIRPAQPDSVYGAFAYGLSGFSDTFVSFNGGPGQLGIHGTNEPDTIGTNVSSGCIRMHNDDITRMVEELKVTAGVPVEVL